MDRTYYSISPATRGISLTARRLFAALMGLALLVAPMSGKFYVFSSRPVVRITKDLHYNSHSKNTLSLDKRYDFKRSYTLISLAFLLPVLPAARTATGEIPVSPVIPRAILRPPLRGPPIA